MIMNVLYMLFAEELSPYMLTVTSQFLLLQSSLSNVILDYHSSRLVESLVLIHIKEMYSRLVYSLCVCYIHVYEL